MLTWRSSTDSGRIEVIDERGVLRGWIGHFPDPYIVVANQYNTKGYGDVLRTFSTYPQHQLCNSKLEQAVYTDSTFISCYLLLLLNKTQTRKDMILWLASVYNNNLWSHTSL